MDPFTIATLGLSAYSAWKGGSEASKQSSEQSRLSQVQIDEVNKSLEALIPTKESKMQVAQQEYQHGALSLGMGKEEANKQLDDAIQKSGLVTSADITQKQSSVWRQFQHSATGLYGQLGKSMGGIEEWFEGEKSRLEGTKKRAQLQKNAADKASGSWYLGKNIESLV